LHEQYGCRVFLYDLPVGLLYAIHYGRWTWAYKLGP
jgi:hypothetical protein